VRAADLRPSKHFSRSPARGWTRAARICLVLLACLAQSWMPAQQRHAPGIAAHSVVYDTATTGSGLTPASFDAGRSGVPCAVPSTRASPNGGDGPAPCHHDDCPFCPCFSQVHAAMGILPQEMSRAGYAPPYSQVAPPPVRLGSAARFATFTWQPRAPPILI
jgi:hypothetical protein